MNTLIGKKFNKLLVLQIIDSKHLLCKCDCGNEKVMYKWGLLDGRTISCGCWKKKVLTFHKHGLSYTKFFSRWAAMIQRCTNPNTIEWQHYGGKGIKVCKEWSKFLNFKNDMHETFQQHAKFYGEHNTTLERLNNNKGYSPKNCKWATRKVQNRHSSQNHYITYKGKTLTIAEWAEKLNFPYKPFYSRIHNGMGMKKAILKSHLAELASSAELEQMRLNRQD